jgi:hypothetical protein
MPFPKKRSVNKPEAPFGLTGWLWERLAGEAIGSPPARTPSRHNACSDEAHKNRQKSPLAILVAAKITYIFTYSVFCQTKPILTGRTLSQDDLTSAKLH